MCGGRRGGRGRGWREGKREERREREREEQSPINSPPHPLCVVPSLQPSRVVALWNQSGTSVELSWKVGLGYSLYTCTTAQPLSHNNIHCHSMP